MAETGRIQLFYSYAHQDEQYRKGLLDALSDLRDEGVIADWHDRMIVPGADWRQAISSEIAKAHVILFLISPSFMSSSYCIGVEVKEAIELHWARRCRIVPVLIHPAPGWRDTNFGTFQALPRDAKPVSEWRKPEFAFADIALGIRNVCKEIVDWENPFRRGHVGDWIQHESTAVNPVERKVSRGRTCITQRDDHHVTTFTVADVDGLRIAMSVDFSLDVPVEDSFGSILKQAGESIGDASQFWREETGQGEQKLIVGGRPYYCTWFGRMLRLEQDGVPVVISSKTWHCIDVPVDGLVKEETVYSTAEGQEFHRASKVLIGFSWQKQETTRENLVPQLLPPGGPGRIQTLCLNCRTKIAIEERHLLKRIRCPECRTEFRLIKT